MATSEDRVRRLRLIRQLEAARNSDLIIYITGDRQSPVSTQLGEDAMRPFYDHILSISRSTKRRPRMDMFLYSRGGGVEVPWRLVSMVREYYEEFDVLIPYKAHSAATMIALGGDSIVMGPKGELGPIDPSTHMMREVTGPQHTERVSEVVNVEDVMSFVSFLRDRAGLTDQAAISSAVNILVTKLQPWAIGGIYRTHSHINLVARKLMDSRKVKVDESKAASTVKALVEEIYLHGHAIARKEATNLGLPIEVPDKKTEELMWSLYAEYEEMLQLRSPIDPNTYVPQDRDQRSEPTGALACIESRAGLHVFGGTLTGLVTRQMPAQLNLNVNLNLPPLPPAVQSSPEILIVS
ncbi:MAG: hypothetical protein HY671_08780 [Chloroflexi bacterium]|nr:hypothetical protein [Chloroflexota bacterium]